jgi:hypothetical protein
MKKQNLKVLTFSKSTISKLEAKTLHGGANTSGFLSCKKPIEPVTVQVSCKDSVHNWCDSRFGGCNTYYCG